MIAVTRRIYRTFETLFHEMAKFGIVGAINVVVDVGLFTLLRLTVLDEKPLTAKIISTAVAILSSYFMNRHWTWKHTNRAHPAREILLFFVISGIGMAIAVGCLAISHYVLDFTSVLADNIAANGVGLALGMVWRFWAFKRFIFTPIEPAEQAEQDALDATFRTNA